MRCTDVGQKPRNIAVGHAVPLRKIAEGGAELAVRTAVLAHNHHGGTGIRLFNIDREL